MKVLLTILFLLIPALGYAIEYTKNFGDYTITLSTRDNNESLEEEIVTIKKGSEVVFSHKDFRVYLNTKGYKEDNRQNFQIEDLTGNDIKNFIVKSYSGGAHCCNTTFILELGPEFKLVHKFDTEDSDVVFKKVPGYKGIYAVLGDQAFTYFYGPFSASIFPELIYYCEEDKCRPDLKAMAKPKFTDKEFDTLVLKVKKELEIENYFNVPVIKPAINLVYSGNADQAWKLIDLTWNDKKVLKEKFMKDFKCRLQKSHYFNVINELNKNKIPLEKDCDSNKEADW
jgi:hypothetical protein